MYIVPTLLGPICSCMLLFSPRVPYLPFWVPAVGYLLGASCRLPFGCQLYRLPFGSQGTCYPFWVPGCIALLLLHLTPFRLQLCITFLVKDAPLEPYNVPSGVSAVPKIRGGISGFCPSPGLSQVFQVYCFPWVGWGNKIFFH